MWLRLFILMHDDAEPAHLGWRGFVIFMAGVFAVVVLFDWMARRSIKSIHQAKGNSRAASTRTSYSRLSSRLKRLLARARR
jgi:hypothetical protein